MTPARIVIEDIRPIKAENGLFSCSVPTIYLQGTCHTPTDSSHTSAALKSFEKSNKNAYGNNGNDINRDRLAFRREYELLRSFKDPETNAAYPYIVSAYLFVDTYADYAPLFLMELADYSLYDVLMDRRILTGDTAGCYTIGHCISFLRQICRALAYLHSGIKYKGETKPIIHRDLKSCNVLLFSEGTHCKLCDFGISRPVEDGMTAPTGTAGWTAPELLHPSRDSDGICRYTVAADCFSFGAVICEALFRAIPKNIGRNDDVSEPSETVTQVESKVHFFSERRKLLYLSEATFSEIEAFRIGQLSVGLGEDLGDNVP